MDTRTPQPKRTPWTCPLPMLYGKGWMIKISIDNEAELAELLSADAYKTLIGA